ncbi:hypothetical protein E2C01_058190 [Portunus trituberculatus]|uniref:Uncharacterized protein n=1 Tax=Portunus trituberculatus TaxID=210409 RepID=A0A5B7H2B6_PORTR|nr:hypothetical protein [Portunus trituberculatus]
MGGRSGVWCAVGVGAGGGACRDLWVPPGHEGCGLHLPPSPHPPHGLTSGCQAVRAALSAACHLGSVQRLGDAVHHLNTRQSSVDESRPVQSRRGTLTHTQHPITQNPLIWPMNQILVR